MKIAYFQVPCDVANASMAALTARVEHLRGVVGAAAVRSMGLLSVLYDEGRTDPVRIADAVAASVAALAQADEAAAAPVLDSRRVTRGRRPGWRSERVRAVRMGGA